MPLRGRTIPACPRSIHDLIYIDMDEKFNELKNIRITAIFLHSSLSSSNIGEVIVAQAELDALIDEFQAAYSDYVSRDDIANAKKDIEFFLKLIDSTARQCRNKSSGETG